MAIDIRKYVLVNVRTGETVFGSDTREGLKTFETNDCAGIYDTQKGDTFQEYVAIGRPFELEEVQAVKRVYAKAPVKKSATKLVNMSRGEVVRVSDELCKLTNYKPPYINDVLCQFKAVGKPYRVKVETTRHIVHIPADDKPSVTTWQ